MRRAAGPYIECQGLTHALQQATYTGRPASHGWLPHRGANLGCDYPATAAALRVRRGLLLGGVASGMCAQAPGVAQLPPSRQVRPRKLRSPTHASCPWGLYAEATRLSSCLPDSSRQQMRSRARSSKRNPTASGPAVFSFAANACMAINITDRCAFSTGFSTSKPTDLRALPTIRMSLSHPLSWW